MRIARLAEVLGLNIELGRPKKHQEAKLQIFWSFVAAVVGWITLEFIGRPFRSFFDLRGDTIRILVEFANVPARWKPIRDDTGAESGEM